MRYSSKKLNNKRQKKLIPYLFIAPNAILFFTFVFVPAIIGGYYSFFAYDGINAKYFVGFDNYIEIFQYSDSIQVLTQSMVYSFACAIGIFTVALYFANILVKDLKGRKYFRAAIYLPCMISYIVSGVAWRFMLSEDFGLINFFITALGGEKIEWLTNVIIVKFVVVFVTMWFRIGFYMIIFISGLQSIPETLYEVARIDGASKMQCFYKITLPLLMPTSILVFILSSIDALKSFGLIYALTGGGPGFETTYLVQYSYMAGINSRLGFASAVSMVMFIMLAALTLIQFAISRRMVR